MAFCQWHLCLCSPLSYDDDPFIYQSASLKKDLFAEGGITLDMLKFKNMYLLCDYVETS